MAAEPSFQGIQELGLEAFERARALEEHFVEEHPDDFAICSDSPPSSCKCQRTTVAKKCFQKS